MKRFRAFTALICILLLVVPGELAFAAPAAKLFLDGQPLASDVPPTIVNNRTLVPLRVIMESLGASVHWTSNSEPIVIRKNEVEIQLQVGKQQVLVNGQTVNLDVAPSIIRDRAMVPLRFIGESLGAGIWWDPSERAVYITSPTGQLGPATFLEEQGLVTGIAFEGTRSLDLSPLELSEDGRTASLVVRNATAEAASQQINSGDLAGYTVESLDANSTRITLTFGERGRYLLPQAELSTDGTTLTWNWPLALKDVLFHQSGGVERLTFPLPSTVQPQVKDTTIEIETGASLPGRILVNDGANVRTGPSETADRLRVMPYNTEVEVVGITSGWYEVRLDADTTGWIADWLVGVETETETQVGVNVRSTPSTNGKDNILTTLYPGHQITVLKREEGWCLVEYGAGKQGYIADHLVPLESRLVGSDKVPGVAITFPGVIKGEQVAVSLKNSSLFTAADWQADATGLVLNLQLKQAMSHRLTQTDIGWALTFGTWVERVTFTSTERGPRVRLTVDGSSQPTVRYDSANATIIMTVAAATLAEDMDRVVNGDGTYITQIKAEQVGTEVQLSVKLTRALAYHIQKTGSNTWELVVASPTLVNKLIAIDPGHGAIDIGAPGTLGWHEADYTHDIAYRLRDLLQQAGANVFMTRVYESAYIQGPARAAKINEAGADLFISIHINSATNRAARGIETWYYPRGDNEHFARVVQDKLIAVMGWPDRGIKSGRYIICRDTLTTGAMAELGFISNATDEGLLNQAAVRQRLAQALFDAMEQYFAQR